MSLDNSAFWDGLTFSQEDVDFAFSLKPEAFSYFRNCGLVDDYFDLVFEDVCIEFWTDGVPLSRSSFYDKLREVVFCYV